MAGAKRHHYLPVSYLKRFTDDGSDKGILHVYDIRKRECRGQTPLNTAVQGYYNAIEKKDGTRNLRFENDLAALENQLVPIIDNIDCGAPLTRIERKKLAFYVAVQIYRGPDFEDQVRSVVEPACRRIGKKLFANYDRAKEILARRNPATGEVLEVPPKAISEMFASDAYNVEVSRNASLHMMERLAPEIADLIIEMNWAFLHISDGETFVTSDQPFSFTAPPRQSRSSYPGILTPGCRKLFPLSAKVCLVIFDRGYGASHRSATAKEVELINWYVAANAFHYLIGRDEKTVRRLAQVMVTKFDLRWGGARYRCD